MALAADAAADAIADAEMTVAVSGSSFCFSAVAAALAAALAADATVAVDAIADADANAQLERISRCNKTIAISPVQQTVPGILFVAIYFDCSWFFSFSLPFFSFSALSLSIRFLSMQSSSISYTALPSITNLLLIFCHHFPFFSLLYYVGTLILAFAILIILYFESYIFTTL